MINETESDLPVRCPLKTKCQNFKLLPKPGIKSLDISDKVQFAFFIRALDRSVRVKGHPLWLVLPHDTTTREDISECGKL